MSGAEQARFAGDSPARREPADPRHTGLVPILVATNSLGLAATSIYSPSLPAIARALAVPVGTVQETITAYLAAYGVGMLLIGPLSDRFGRRHLLIGGTALFAAASVLAAFAHRIEVLLLARVLQAIGACAGMALGRAIARDVFDHEGTARAMAAISVAVGLTPVLAPLVGGYVQVWWGWRANFAILALVAIPVWAAVTWRVPETNRHALRRERPQEPRPERLRQHTHERLYEQRHESLPGALLSGLLRLGSERRFMGYTFVVAGTTSMFYAFLTAAPVLLIDRFGVTPDAFGRYVVLGTCGATVAAFVSARTVGRLGIDTLIRTGVALLVIAGLLLAGFASVARPLAVVFPLCFVGVGMGLCLPNANAGGLGIHPQLAGTAAGLSGFIQMIACGAATLVMAAVESRSALPLAMCWLCSASLACLGIFLARSPRDPRAPRDSAADNRAAAT
jgi:DHA1 family bicyclomycin/chloramphenicol resistance-like MFS transporter